MRITILFFISFLLVKNSFAVTYTWTGTGGNKLWNTNNNWAPVGVPTSADDVIFNVSDSINFTFSQTVNSLKIQGTNTIVVFACNSTTTTFSSPRTITISNPSTLPDAFFIASTCKLIMRTFNSSTTCYFTLDMSQGIGVKGIINGELELGGPSNSLSRVEFKTTAGAVSYGRVNVFGKIICQSGAASQAWSPASSAATLTFMPQAECIWNKDGGSIGSPYFSVGSWLRLTNIMMNGFLMPTGPYIYSRNANVEVNSPSMGSGLSAALYLRGIPVDTLKLTNTGGIGGVGDVRYSTGAVTASSIDTIRGSLIITANGKLDMGASSVNTAIEKVVVLGDVINAGKIVKSGSSIDTLEFASPNVYQTLNSTGTFNTDQVSIKINTRDSVILASPFTVNKSLNLKKGWIISSDASLLTIKSSASITNYSDLSFVIGPVANTTDAYVNFEYPLGYLITGNTGLSRSVRTLGVITPTITAAYKVRYVRASPYGIDAQVNSPLDHVSNLEYWKYDFIGGAGSYLVRLTWYDPNSGGVTDVNNLRVACKDAIPGWSNYGSNPVTIIGAGGAIPSTRFFNAATGVPNPYYTLASITADNPLPLILLQFTGELQNNANAVLHWRFAQMNDGVKMYLQESDDGLLFKTSAIITGNNLQNAYSHTTSITSTKKYFRLMWHNGNNDEVFSNIILLNKKADENYAFLYPNPVQQFAHLQINATSASKEVISVFDLSGKLIFSKAIALQKGLNIEQIDCRNLTAGVYTIRISNGLVLKMQK